MPEPDAGKFPESDKPSNSNKPPSGISRRNVVRRAGASLIVPDKIAALLARRRQSRPCMRRCHKRFRTDPLIAFRLTPRFSTLTGNPNSRAALQAHFRSTECADDSSKLASGIVHRRLLHIDPNGRSVLAAKSKGELLYRAGFLYLKLKPRVMALPLSTAFDNHMTPSNLTGVPGIAPVSWSFSAGKMIASYSSTFNVGDVPSVLWFTTSAVPELGGDIGLSSNNAFLLSGTTVIFTNAVISPTPEPSTWTLALGGILIAVFAGSNRAKPRSTGE